MKLQTPEELKRDQTDNEVSAMKLVLEALIAAHPAPVELLMQWERVSEQTVAKLPPLASHAGLPTKEEWFRTYLRHCDSRVRALVR